jgi:hypothetical protein
MSLYSAFATDKQLEQDGVLLDYGPNSKDQPIQIRIARAGGNNAKFAKVLQKRMDVIKRQIKTMDNKAATKLMIEVYADSVVLGWTGVQDRDGNDLEFTRENVVKLFTDLPDLFADVQQQSQDIALFREEIRQADSGN